MDSYYLNNSKLSLQYIFNASYFHALFEAMLCLLIGLPRRCSSTEDNGLQMDYLYSAFPTNGQSKRFTMLPHIHPFMHTHTHRRWRRPRKATDGSSGAVRARCQRHLDTQLGGAGDRNQQPSSYQPTHSTS